MRRLVLFARPAEIGKVKTRLSPALPPAAACTLYRGMLADAVAALRGARAAQERLVYWAQRDGDSKRRDPADLPRSLGAPAATGPILGRASSEIVERAQGGGDLGARLASAFDELLAAPGDHAVIFGADCPALDAGVIDEAFALLERSPLVLAPSRDGGYALIGLARLAPSLFDGLAWSTERVLDQTIERARALGLGAARLAPLDDVDTGEDVCRLVAEAVTSGARLGPGTRAALTELGLLPDAF